MNPNITPIAIVLNGYPLVNWKSFSIDLDLLTPADGFESELSTVLPADMKAAINPASFTIDMGAKPLMSGIIDEFHSTVAKDLKNLYLSGRDKIGMLLDSNPEKKVSYANMTLEAIAKAVCGPFGINVVAGPPAKVKTSVSGYREETVWTTLSEAAKDLGCLIWTDPAGNLIIDKPAIAAPEYAFNLYLMDPKKSRFTNVKKVEWMKDHSKRPSTITITGSAASSKSDKKKTRKKQTFLSVNGTAMDSEMIAAGIVRNLVERGEKVGSIAAAMRRAKQKIAIAKLKGDKYKVTVRGFEQNGIPFGIGKTAIVNDDYHGFTAKSFLIAAVSFRRSKQEGDVSDITLTPPEGLL